ncbi:MAG: efflux RND transporter periplasmic adaptor subunit [Candidatus Scalindua sp.]|nr:efflux RND transporter periplasmic adaptor subunit [Candidatus Scalindua sp.]
MKFDLNKLIYYVVFIIACFLAKPVLLTADDTEDYIPSELDCFIEPFITVNLGSDVVGIIKEIKVDRGDVVEKGEILVRLDTRVEEANLKLTLARTEMIATIEAREANLEYTVREHERMKELHKQDIVAFEEIDMAKTKMLIAKREWEAAEEQRHIVELEHQKAKESVEKRIIRSPIKGVVIEKYISIGELVDKKPILKLAQLDPLNVEVIAPVSLLGSFKVGDLAEIIPEHLVGTTYIGKVKIVDKVIDATSGTFGMRIELPNPDYSIPAGLQCSIRIQDNKTVSSKTSDN